MKFIYKAYGNLLKLLSHGGYAFALTYIRIN